MNIENSQLADMNESNNTPVMAYTQNSILWGNLQSTGNILPGRILVGNNLPAYITLLDAKSMNMNGAKSSPSKSNAQLHIPVAQIIGFHVMPPHQDQLDYDESDPLRNFKYFSTMVGDFQVEGALRLPPQSDIKWAIESAKSDFISFYKVKITHPTRPNMAPLSPQMAYLRRNVVIIAEE